LGFAIPIDDVIGILSDLKEFGYVTSAYLGVYVRDVVESAQLYGIPAGVYVEETMPGLAADRAGMQAGDVIVNLGGYDVASLTELTRLLRKFDAGDTTSVTVYRGGSLVYLTVTLDEKPIETTQQTPETESLLPSEEDYAAWFEFIAPFFGYGSESE
jgi:serine protease Do